jgi:hypothetical protein
MKVDILRNDGAWIFLSHSHKDIAQVRQIRDELERLGHNPLIFFLKCLEDDESELPDLLRREIEARTWFILCDSVNSRVSNWVQEEVKMIKSLQGKVFEVIDLSNNLQKELHKLIVLSKRATVFLSYAYKDLPLARRIAYTLKQSDYRVFLDMEDLPAASDIFSTVRAAIDDAIGLGFVLVLLSEDALTSEWCKEEAQYALGRARASQKSNVIPIIIGKRAAVSDALPLHLAAVRCFDLTVGDFDERMAELISHLKTSEME